MTYCLLTDYILVCGFRLASGDVASKVVIEKRMESVMAFYKGSGDFYLGYVTLKVLSLSVCLSLLQQSLTLVQYITISFFQFSCLAFVTCHGENNLVNHPVILRPAYVAEEVEFPSIIFCTVFVMIFLMISLFLILYCHLMFNIFF